MNENNSQPAISKQNTHPKMVNNNTSKWIYGAIVAALILMWFAPPLAAELYLSKNIDKFINADATEDVNLKANTLQLLAGKFNSFHISGNNLVIGNLKVSEYALEASKGQVDILKTLKDRDIILKKSPIVTLTLHVDIVDMQELLQYFYPSIKELRVEAFNDDIYVSGISETPEGIDLPISFKATLTADDWASMYVKAYDMETEKDVASEVLTELTDIYSISIPFNQTTPPIYINKIKVNEDEIIITANSALN